VITVIALLSCVGIAILWESSTAQRLGLASR
jgi:hypothetical protein